MATQARSQAAMAAELLTKANDALGDAAVALQDVRDLTSSPNGEPVPHREALALVGMTAVARRSAGWVTDGLSLVERALIEQCDLASEVDDDAR